MHLGGGFNRLERNEEDLTRKAPTALGIPGLSVPVLDWGDFQRPLKSGQTESWP